MLHAQAIEACAFDHTVAAQIEGPPAGGGRAYLYVSVDPVQNPRWFEFFRGRGYRALQLEPYRKLESRSSVDGRIEEVLAWRRDLVVELSRNGPA